jgi:hypothetical protein
MSVNGIDYFPKEFATQTFINLMDKRKIKLERMLTREQKRSTHKDHHVPTQQNVESEMDLLSCEDFRVD